MCLYGAVHRINGADGPCHVHMVCSHMVCSVPQLASRSIIFAGQGLYEDAGSNSLLAVVRQDKAFDSGPWTATSATSPRLAGQLMRASRVCGRLGDTVMFRMARRATTAHGKPDDMRRKNPNGRI